MCKKLTINSFTKTNQIPGCAFIVKFTWTYPILPHNRNIYFLRYVTRKKFTEVDRYQKVLTNYIVQKSYIKIVSFWWNIHISLLMIFLLHTNQGGGYQFPVFHIPFAYFNTHKVHTVHNHSYTRIDVSQISVSYYLYRIFTSLFFWFVLTCISISRFSCINIQYHKLLTKSCGGFMWLFLFKKV